MLQNLRENHVAQRIQLRRVAEHIGFADGDFVQQQSQFCIAISTRSKVLQIFRRAGHAQCIHTARTSRGQKIKLLFGMIDSGNPIDQIANLQIRRIALNRLQIHTRLPSFNFDGHRFIFRPTKLCSSHLLRIYGDHHRGATAAALRIETRRTSSAAMPPSGNMPSASLAATTLPGIPQTTDDASS